MRFPTARGGLLCTALHYTALHCTLAEGWYNQILQTVGLPRCRNQSEWDGIVECSDPRQFCVKVKDYVSYYTVNYKRTGCGIPEGLALDFEIS